MTVSWFGSVRKTCGCGNVLKMSRSACAFGRRQVYFVEPTEENIAKIAEDLMPAASADAQGFNFESLGLTIPRTYGRSASALSSRVSALSAE